MIFRKFTYSDDIQIENLYGYKLVSCKMFWEDAASSAEGITQSSVNNLLLKKTCSGVTLLFEHSPIQVSEIDHSEICSHLQENQLAQWFFVKFNLLLFFLIS